MKNILTAFCFLAFSAAAIAQGPPDTHKDSVKTVFTTLKKGEKYMPVTELKVAYDNVIRVKPKADTIKQIGLQVTPGAVLQRGDDWVVRVDQPGDVWIDVYSYTVPNSPRLIERRKFTAVKTAPLKASILGIEVGDITREKLMKVKKIDLENPEKDKGLMIKTFKMSMDAQEATAPVFTSKNDKLTSDMKKAIKTARKGSYIYFEYIKVGYKKEQNLRTVNAVKLHVID